MLNKCLVTSMGRIISICETHRGQSGIRHNSHGGKDEALLTLHLENISDLE